MVAHGAARIRSLAASGSVNAYDGLSRMVLLPSDVHSLRPPNERHTGRNHTCLARLHVRSSQSALDHDPPRPHAVAMRAQHDERVDAIAALVSAAVDDTTDAAT